MIYTLYPIIVSELNQNRAAPSPLENRVWAWGNGRASMRTYCDFVLVDNLMIDSINHHYICVCNFVKMIRCDYSIQLLLYLIYCYD